MNITQANLLIPTACHARLANGSGLGAAMGIGGESWLVRIPKQERDTCVGGGPRMVSLTAGKQTANHP